ncbi:MAG: hypothetical protein HY513_02390 [Candidatus Aenigmarchaeota archaeon]|nr:hypothetical protein [Candidatus Aenigmarchaeota archaeon]
MKFYIAARFDNKEKVWEIYEKLKEKGHEIHSDWTVHQPFYPYISDPELCAKYSEEDVNGAMNCDVFVLLADEHHNGQHEQKAKSHGRGMFIELGTAMSSFLLRGSPRIFVIGPDNDKAIFHFHNSVTRFDTIEEVLENLEL